MLLEPASWADVERLVQEKIPEGATLEYKRELTVSTAGERKETLKDLTGMGNGGEGVILFGVEEEAGASELPSAIMPMTDRGKVGVLEDIVRAGVRPPLLMELKELSGPGGYVLVAHVQRSPLGPYMVEAYGERRYHKRVGTRSVPMTEQEISDAYRLAERAAEQRPNTWKQHRLPVRALNDDPWLTVCL